MLKSDCDSDLQQDRLPSTKESLLHIPRLAVRRRAIAFSVVKIWCCSSKESFNGSLRERADLSPGGIGVLWWELSTFSRAVETQHYQNHSRDFLLGRAKSHQSSRGEPSLPCKLIAHLS